GHRWKRSNAWSLMILIGRQLDFTLDGAEALKMRSIGARSRTKKRNPTKGQKSLDVQLSGHSA
ncbi:MAG: hypothetical protein IJ708_00880, partial [Clostridia bacterium]|nr:hypothetical protein [Clostridia bacterium]